jgi:hypothetical protein
LGSQVNATEPAYVNRTRKLVVPVPRYGRLVLKLTRVFHFYSLEFGYTHYANCTGVLSRFRNTGLQSVFADFDTGPLSRGEDYERRSLAEVEEDIEESASHVAGLGSFFIFESSPGHYHAIDFSLQDVMAIRRFLAGLKYGDHRYLAWLVRYGENTVRISEKQNERRMRPIRFARFHRRDHSSLIHHGGLIQLYESLYPEIKRYTQDLQRDGSSMDDLLIFDYKTMTW